MALAYTLTPLERRSIFTPLGIRFIDATTGAQIREGLLVTARLASGAGPTMTAFRTVSGQYAFQGLPGLRALEYPLEEAVGLPPSQTFVVEVTDRQQRFVPVAFEVSLPLLERGLYRLAPATSPPEQRPPGFYLFSTPTRPVAPGLAVVRANLVDAVTANPAAHAMLEVEVPSVKPDGASVPKKWVGTADDRGRVAVLFPYPVQTQTLIGSPPSSPPRSRLPLSQATWEVTVRVRYAPDDLVVLPGAAVPGFRSIAAQRPGMIVPDASSASVPPVPALPATLRYGAALVLRTQGRAALLLRRQGVASHSFTTTVLP